MGRLDNVRRIVKEDYDAKYHALIDRLAFVLNSFMEQVVQQVNGNIDFTNLNQEIISFRVTVDSNGTPIGNNIFRSGINQADGLLVIEAVNRASTTIFPTTAPFISFSNTSANIIKINNITGLQANSEYDLKILVIGK